MANYNVNLTFTADTKAAKAQLQSLKANLQSLSTGANLDVNADIMSKKLNEASQAARELKAHLDAATNVQTGNLDFTKLNKSLKDSNMTLVDYGKHLKALGVDGQRAFVSLTRAVMNAEVPLRKTSDLVDKMLVTFGNNLRWMASSSVLNGITQSLSSAYSYAQNLNKSLNDIRIVTGYNADQMADFAVQANKAAKALNTSTTSYTRASLIYYQQGLSEREVQERTDVTVKLANVTSQSAETISEQLTSVWNNFYDGSKSLEYYADVMTKLGAATASSSDEIAEGLNKFAAVADTVGLSYEYAASALATVTATTRESADIVGNSFKTLFSRIQGLNLGETQDDGTTLNKYSQALASVGVNIKDTSGNLKDMDAILDDLGAKWATLSKNQQVALAQTVGGKEFSYASVKLF